MKKLKLIFIVLIIFSFNNLMADNNENLKSKITKKFTLFNLSRTISL